VLIIKIKTWQLFFLLDLLFALWKPAEKEKRASPARKQNFLAERCALKRFTDKPS
jgi:hypothetical protein